MYIQGRRTVRALVAGVLVVAGLTSATGSTGAAAPLVPLPPTTADWLTTMNAYRMQSGLAPVTENAEWTAGLRAHLTYLANTPADLRTGAYASAHTENPASPWYTPAGAAGGASSNLGGGSNEATSIDGWMTAPFHAIGILRPGLTSSAFAMSGGAAALDVIRGYGYAPATTDIVFPGDGSTTRLTSTGGESPDPTEGCSATPSVRFSGLPLIVMGAAQMPAGTTARLDLPSGSTLSQGADLCVQTAATYHSSDPVYGPTGQSIISGANAAFIIPRVPLVAGRYTAHLVRPGRPELSWTFTVITAPGAPTNVRAIWAGNGKVLMSWDAPAGDVTSYRAGAQGGDGTTVPGGQRSAVVAATVTGSNVTVSVTGSNGAGTGGPGFGFAFLPRLPGRTTFSSSPNIVAAATSAPSGSSAVLANIAMTGSSAPGYVTADRCDRLVEGPQSQASGNHPAVESVSNLAVVALGAEGAFCLYNQVPTDLVVDVQGTFSPQGALRFQSLAFQRRLDTRVSGAMPTAGQIVAVDSGAPAGTQAVLVNLAMVEAVSPGYITADACSRLQAGPQTKASGNHGIGGAVSNLAVVPVDADGRFCIYTQVPIHLVADVQGAFGPSGPLALDLAPPTRRIDTRSDGVPAQAGTITRVSSGAPAGSVAALVNIAMVGGAAAGYVTADRCDLLASGPQTRSSGNHGVGGAVANLAVVSVDQSGDFCIYSNVATELVIDVQGYFSPSGTSSFDLAPPSRVLDTRL